MALTRRLDRVEARVVGALMEKEQTTPDAYPLTVSSLVTACDQKSNREPVTTLGEEAVRDALERLRKDVLVWRVDGARVERWEHRLTSRWQLDSAAKALVTLLLLRGDQTPGELRSRSERMHSFADVTEVEGKMRELEAGEDALVRELPREPGQRENRWRQVMLRKEASSEGAIERQEITDDRAAKPLPRLSRMEERIAELEERVERLENG